MIYPQPSARDIPFMNDADKKKAPQTKFHELSKQVEGNTFIVCARKVQSINDYSAKYRMLQMLTTRIWEHSMYKTVRDTLLQNDANKSLYLSPSIMGGGGGVTEVRSDSIL